jgi:hypothetical protein
MLKILLTILMFFPAFALANAELPDPTRPANYFSESKEPVFFQESKDGKRIWTLSAVRVSKKDRTAILNGKLVREGDKVNQAKVLEISPQSVVIEHDNKKLIVRLFNDLVIKKYKSINELEKNDEN